MYNNVFSVTSDAGEWLDAIYPEPVFATADARAITGAFIEIRILGDRDEGIYGQEWYKSNDDLMSDAPRVMDIAHQHHACVAVSPALRKRKSGTKDDVLGSWCLWNDQNQRDGGQDACIQRLLDDPLDMMVVDSGFAAHGYVLLDELCTDVARIERGNQLLRQRLGGDAVHDASRVMRMPGTVNYKDDAEPRPCRLLRRAAHRWNIDELIELLDREADADKPDDVLNSMLSPDANTIQRLISVMKNLPPETTAMMLESIPVGDRSEHDLAVVNRLVAAGLPDDAIETLFSLYPCGDKARENGFTTYLKRTIRKARSNGSQFLPKASTVTGSPEELRRQIGEIRVAEKTASARQEAIAQVVLDYFVRHGQFFTDGMTTSHLYVDGQTYLLSDNRRFRSLIDSICGLSLENKDGKLALDRLANHALRKGKPATTRGPVYGNRRNQTIYVHPGDMGGDIIRVSPGHVDLVGNGTNEDRVCLTAPPELRPFQFNPEVDLPEALNLYRSTVIENMACDDVDQQTLMLWFPNVFLLDYSTVKIVVKMGGAQASGKTVASRLLGTLLAGSDIVKIRPTVPSIYADSLPLQIFDNVENRDLRRSLEDIVLFSATGGTKEKMRLNTDDERIRREINCLLLLNGIESFDRTEILSRIYEVEFNRQHQQPGFLETEAVDDLLAARDTILSGLLMMFAQHVLPRIRRGGIREWKTYLEAEHRYHPKWRSFEFLARMGLIAEAMAEIENPTSLPTELRNAARQQIDAILARQSRNAVQADVETNALANLIRSLVSEKQHWAKGTLADFTSEYHLDIDLDSDGARFTATANELHYALSVLTKQHGVRALEVHNPRSLAARLSSDREILEHSGIQVTVAGQRFKTNLYEIHVDLSDTGC